MKKMLAIQLVVVMYLLGWPGTSKASDANATLRSLTQELSAGHVTEIEILHMPNRLQTRTRIVPEMLEKQYRYKLTIREWQDDPTWRSLSDELSSTAAAPATEMPDLRWAVVLYGPNHERAGALYFDRTGARGAVNQTPVAFGTEFLKWLNNAASLSLRDQ